METMQIVICDDDEKIQEILREKLERILETICRENGNNIVCQILCYSSGEEMLRAGREPDLLFLDIQMPDKDGMEVAEEMRRRRWNTILIFVTALSEYVYDAFDVGAFHYLVKPFQYDRLQKVFLRALEQYEQQMEQNQLKPQRQQAEDDAVLLVKQGSVSKAVPAERIIYAEVYNRKITLHTMDDAIEYYGKMTELTQQLGDHFYRTHRSYLVNLKYVEKYDSTTVWLERGTVPMAKKQFTGFVKQYMHYISRRGTAEWIR